MSLSRCSSWPELSLRYTEINNIHMCAENTLDKIAENALTVKHALSVVPSTLRLHHMCIKSAYNNAICWLYY